MMFKLIWPPREGIISKSKKEHWKEKQQKHNKNRQTNKNTKKERKKEKDVQTSLAEVRPSAD